MDSGSDWVVSEEARGPKRVEGFVPNERFGEFNRKVEHMQAAARRLGLPAWEVTIGEKEWRPVNVYSEDVNGVPVVQKMQLEGTPISIVGEAPVLAGWRFLAKIEHEGGGNLVKRMVGGDMSPAAWHTCGPDCDHCHVARQRNNTFMLENVDSGETMQVGSSCISDFLGEQYRDPERIAGMYDYLMEMGREFEYDPDKEFVWANLSGLGLRPELLMAAVMKIVQEDGGFISADKAQEKRVMGTGDRLRAAFWSKKPIVVVPDAGHVERAPEVVAWLSGQKESDSLWLRNIAYLADRAEITSKNAGLFASGYVAWTRELERQSKSEKGSGEWVGVKGEKLAVSGTLVRIGGFDTQFGYKTVLTFQDEVGNGLVWKTSSPPEGLVVGASYRLMGTVKDHGEYRGEKQSELIRVKVAELELFKFGTLPAYKKAAALALADVKDDRGHTPLVKAVWMDHVDHAGVLVAAGADANQLHEAALPILAFALSGAMAEVLLTGGARAADLSDGVLQGMDAGAREAVVKARGGAGLENESDQERSWREAGEAFYRVNGDIEEADDVDLRPASYYANKLISGLQDKAQRGEDYDENLLRALKIDVAAIRAEIVLRAELTRESNERLVKMASETASSELAAVPESVRVVTCNGDAISKAEIFRAEAYLESNSYKQCNVNLSSGNYHGRVLAVLNTLVVQETRKGHAVIHDKDMLGSCGGIAVGDMVDIKYRGVKGIVTVDAGSCKSQQLSLL